MRTHSPTAGTPPESNPAPWEHVHDFGGGNAAAERGTRLVMGITAAMMVFEIAAGWAFNSMALLADGWHMSSHALAIGMSAFAYAAARRYAKDARFAFGTWKIEVLGGFASALFLLGVAVMMVVGSAERLFSPQPIQYFEAIAVGVVGLAVNVVCALILGRAHRHGAPPEDPVRVLSPSDLRERPHSHSHGHSHGSHGDDLNLRAAYLHVIADATTSVLAILALAGGWWLGWSWLDPLMGMAGAVLVGHWAVGLIRDTSSALLDRDMDHPVVEEIREVLHSLQNPARTDLTDLHVWRVGQSRYACAMTVVTDEPSLDATQIRQALAVHEEIVHATIEVHFRPD